MYICTTITTLFLPAGRHKRVALLRRTHSGMRSAMLCYQGPVRATFIVPVLSRIVPGTYPFSSPTVSEHRRRNMTASSRVVAVQEPVDLYAVV